MQAPGELLNGDPGQNQNPAAGFLIKSEPGSLSSRNEELVVPEEGIQRELERLSGKLEEQKLKAKHLQLNLAGKIVILEEQLEQASIEHEERIQQLERAHQEEVRRLTAGVEQREAQLLQLCDDYREEARDLQFKLETSWKPAEESKTIQKMEKGTRGNLYKLMKDEYERLFRTN
jgi:t-SNARE complex subunit (syntaxin)